jgi:UDP-N-acetylglucosamine 4,6-dehydratase
MNCSITDERMTKFMTSLEVGAELVWHAFCDMIGSEIYVKKIASMRVVNLARVVAPWASFEIVGIRPCEKLHEQMIGSEESFFTLEYKEHFKILSAINNWFKNKERIKDRQLVEQGFSFTSDNNSVWLNEEDLRNWLATHSQKIGKY